ncbi:hypothetical protein I7X39_17340 [Inhella sp. 1Y17]|uniref:Uncharacterized protein n=1 Tax=Inhella proteolytica TaxID=2795029 RepID=A0A931NJ48_9BURK|nr:hypothetical protein [Inhella proteolytica]
MKFGSDISSWYWWLSVVFVGIAINLASSYVKPPMDRWIERRSDRRRVAREARDKVFGAKVARISVDPTLLILAGQEAAQCEIRSQLTFILVGVNLILLFIVTSLPEPRSGVIVFLIYSLVVILPVQLMILMKELKDEANLVELYRAARERFNNRN